MRVYGMKVNHLVNPLGFSLSPVRFSYKTLCEGAKRQQAARLRVYDEADAPVFDSGLREDIDSLCFAPELSLSPRARYTWDVLVRADDGREALSPRAWFETAKLNEPWAGRWIAADESVLSARLFKRFSLPAPVLSARLYICGLGLYEACVNGKKAGDEYLAPACNDYGEWLQYQTYDVTDLLKEENELSVLLGDGWYKGRFGFRKHTQIYGDTQTLLCELRVKLADGREVVVPSDASWSSEESKVRASSIYDGEYYDASYTPAKTLGVRLIDRAPGGKLMARLSPPVRVMRTLRPAAVIHTPSGETVLDMGQNMTGFLSFRAQGEKGRVYHYECGETLQDGCFYRENLRDAKAEYTFVSDGNEAWARPYFTFYGFRYAKLTGFEKVDLDDFVGCVLYSDMDQVGFVRTSDEKVNRLAQNALWGQRGNFLDVPTDCPQRNERMGWTGDAQVFCATALYQMDATAFYTKFLYDMELEQRVRGGAVPHVVPSFDLGRAIPSCAWADAAAIMPWTIYLFSGDRTLLAREYANMTLWVDWIKRTDDETGAKRLWHVGFHYADWLALDAEYPASCTGGTDPYFIASAYYLYSTRLTEKAARALGKKEDAEKYDVLAREILAAIRREYVTDSGRLAVTSQTAYILALLLGLLPAADEPRARAALDRKFEDSHGELRTGFVGTAYLCRVLTKNGFAFLAYSLFLRQEYPGWLYEVNMGATTVWERWNSILPDGHISSTGMNSLNHYAYGSVMEWVYGDAAGLSPREDAPGFRKVSLAPHPDARLPEIAFQYESPVGRYVSETRVTGENTFEWKVEVPFGGEAELTLPRCDVKGNAVWHEENGRMKAIVPAGRYAFSCVFECAPWAAPLMDRTFAQLLLDPAIKESIYQTAPHLDDLFAEKPADSITFRQLRMKDTPLIPASEMLALCELFKRLSFENA